MPPLSFFSHAHIPMVNVPGGIFVKGASNFQEDNPPTWTQVSPFSLSLSHVTEEEFLQVMKGEDEAQALMEIERSYRNSWQRPLESTQHPMTQVSWNDAKLFCSLLSKVKPEFGVLNLPTDDQMEYAMRGPAVNLRERMEIEGINIGDFAEWAGDRFENFVTRLELGARILNDPKDKVLRKILEGKKEVYAWRVYGTLSGRVFEKKADGTIVKNAWYDEWGEGKKNGTREVERVWRNGDPFGAETANDQIEAGLIHPFGLTDACGNVWGWCEDEVRVGNQTERRLRGGSWCEDGPVGLRAAFRLGGHPDGRGGVVGFRVAAASQHSQSPASRGTALAFTNQREKGRSGSQPPT